MWYEEIGIGLASLSEVTHRQRLDLFLLTGALVVSRFVFRSHLLYDLDSVNFALGIGRFDPRTHQPHPPGYFLYICLGRLLNHIFHNANLALVVLSIAASCGVIILVYIMALEWFGLRAARFAGLLVLCSPLMWFHGIVALTYSVECFFSALLGYLCWRIESGRTKNPALAAIALGVSAGIRQSSMMFLGPLFIYSLRKVTWKARCISIAILGVTLVAWFVPMILASGGYHNYFDALVSLWRAVPAKGTIFNSSPVTSLARASNIALIYLLCFGPAAGVPLRAQHSFASVDRAKKWFTLVWIAPALCFFTFIFLKFVNSGYLLLVLAPACLWFGLWASELYEVSTWRRSQKLALIGACAAVNTLIFLLGPFYCSYRSVRQFEAELESIQDALPQVYSAKDTLIVGFDSHFLGYRHAGYYLPGYLTVQYPEVKLIEGTRVFAMQGRNTELLPRLPAGTFTKFVLFPLPDTRETRPFLQQIKGKFPSQSLHTVRVNGHEFVTGSVTDLRSLFPQAAR